MDKSKKILVIVESPNKCAHIQKYLTEAGYKNVKVIASVGHIMELANQRKSYYNTGITVEDDFSLNLKLSADKSEVMKRLTTAVKWADIIYLMTDGDREGECIAWSLIKFLKLKKGSYVRAVTHEITPKAVVHAIENPIELNQTLVDAALSRMTIDKMLGYRLSPIARTQVGARSVGRCQSAGLKIITDREHEILDFVPESYYSLALNFKKDRQDFVAKYVGTDAKAVEKISDREEANDIVSKCGPDYIISKIETKDRKEAPKPPFCTATYQQEAASRFGLKIKSAMSYAQKLFEGGYITYHRTDDTTLSPEFLAIAKDYVTSVYGADQYVGQRATKKSENAQEGHEALRATNLEMTPEKIECTKLDATAKKIYSLIWRRTVSSVMKDAIWSDTVCTVAGNDQRFSFSASVIKEDGYLAAARSSDELGDAAIKAKFKEGELLQDCLLDLEEKQTKPKPRYTEATFVRELQKQEIGRPSTYASIVETILSDSRGYCKLEGKQIVPTDRGMQLSGYLQRAFPDLISIPWTRDMESKLDEIAAGKTKKHDFLQSFYELLEKSAKAAPKEEVSEENEVICPKCGGHMKVRRSRFGKLFYGCENWPDCDGILSYNK